MADDYVRPSELASFQNFKKTNDLGIFLSATRVQLSDCYRWLVASGVLLVRAMVVNWVDESKIDEDLKKTFSKQDDCILFRIACNLYDQFETPVFRTRGTKHKILNCIVQIVGSKDPKTQGILNRCFPEGEYVEYSFAMCLQDLLTLDEFLWRLGMDDSRQWFHQMMKSHLE